MENKWYKKYFFYFIMIANLGWVYECIFVFFNNKTLVNRGMLYGPWLPIYGFGAIFCISLLEKYKDKTSLLFIYSCLICSVLEYFTSYIYEKIYNVRWWDYSHLPYNINGRICLYGVVLFGIIAVLSIKYLLPVLDKLRKNKYINYLLPLVALIFLFDLGMSTIKPNTSSINEINNIELKK